MEWLDKYNKWKINALDDVDLINELNAIKDNESEIEDRFYKDLSFGTGGLRGVIGAGTNRINIYTVRKITQGLSIHLLNKTNNPKVCISYDSRIKSKLFACETARVLSANNIHVYLVRELMPVPFVSYTTRKLDCSAGIMITASHNPSKYNGYKVYGSDGNQITLEDAQSILEKINNIDCFNDVNIMSLEDGFNNGLVEYISEDIINAYEESTLSLSIIGRKKIKNSKIVYTPLHGSGLRMVTDVLRKDGFSDINIVNEQSFPDGNFPTVDKPNPEEQEALKLGVELAKKINADLVLATDPDCDRVGIAVRKNNEYILPNGNEIGILLFDFICKNLIKNNKMPKSPIVLKTIVTTEMLYAVAKKYGVQVIDTLTGFKFLGEQICLLKDKGEEDRYIFAMEESYGYLSSKEVFDKDGVNACLLICEMYEYYSSKNINLIDQLENLYKEFGYYQTELNYYVFEGVKGEKIMKNIMKELHNHKLEKLLPSKVVEYYDYLSSKMTNSNNEVIKLTLPKSDVLKYVMEDKNSFVIRPSGTEPKIKIYYTVRGNTREECKKSLKMLKNALSSFINDYSKEK